MIVVAAAAARVCKYDVRDSGGGVNGCICLFLYGKYIYNVLENAMHGPHIYKIHNFIN